MDIMRSCIYVHTGAVSVIVPATYHIDSLLKNIIKHLRLYKFKDSLL